eukprot:724516-Pyramimonas_sp.AAC.1
MMQRVAPSRRFVAAETAKKAYMIAVLRKEDSPSAAAARAAGAQGEIGDWWKLRPHHRGPSPRTANP